MIKQNLISSKTFYIDSVSTIVALGITAPDDLYDYLYNNNGSFCLKEDPDGSLEPYNPPFSGKNDFLTEVEPTLYVTTYQGDNYLFLQGAVDFDVHEKCSELDSYML